jgi:hypothetical protein
MTEWNKYYNTTQQDAPVYPVSSYSMINNVYQIYII